MDIIVKFLGIAQDAGIPQIGCNCKICKEIRDGKRKCEYPVSLGIFNKNTNKKFMIEATPSFSKQYDNFIDIENNEKLEGILLTHAHIGHYTGLFSLGRESLNSKKIKVYTSKKMGDFLRKNAPWNQLVKLENIDIVEFENKKRFILDDGLYVTPIEVNHRNEYADTFGFIIESNSNKIFFVPDIDRWEGFESELENLIKNCKNIIVDATFYTKNEIGNIRGRDLSEIPHPTIEQSMDFVTNKKLDPTKIIFTHFNHSNMIFSNDEIMEKIKKKGFIISEENMEIIL